MTTLHSTAHPCRCGYTGDGVHPCHVGRGTPSQCPNPGEERLVARLTCLAGVQMKIGAIDGCYCIQHWAEFRSGAEYATDLSGVAKGTP